MASLPKEDGGRDDDLDEPIDIRRSTFTVLRDVVFRLTQVVEDSTELIGASVHEELQSFREDLLRQVLALIAVVIGASFVTAGLMLLVSRWTDSWPLTLLLFGAIYLGAAALLRLRPDPGEQWK